MCYGPILVKKAGSRLKDGSLCNNIWADCGKCPECKRKRINQWTFRLIQEDKRSIASHFVTLTYSNEVIPFANCGYPTLEHEDIQLFFKRLRKKTKEKIKYYMAGEYSPEELRPHYHIILFNVEDKDLIFESWKKYNDFGEYVQAGIVHIDEVNENTIAYTCKYIDKDKVIPAFDNDDRKPEYSAMSKNLGNNYINEDTKRWHLEDHTRNKHVALQDVKLMMPRYFRDKLYTEEQRKEQNLILEQGRMTAQEKERRAYYQQVPAPNISYEQHKLNQQISVTNKLKKSSKNRSL